jgi:hypothetical protein
MSAFVKWMVDVQRSLSFPFRARPYPLLCFRMQQGILQHMTVSSVPSGLFEISFVQLVLILFRFPNCQSPSFKGLSCHSSTNPGLGFLFYFLPQSGVAD